MRAYAPEAHGWGGSLLLHSLVLAGLFAFARSEETPPPMRWEVSMVTPAAEAAPPEPPRIPAKSEPARRSEPTRVLPQAAPEPVARAIPQPAPVIPQPSPPSPAPAEAPATAHLAAVAAPVAQVAVPASPRVVEAPPPRPAAVAPPPAPDKEAQKRWYAGLRAKLAELKQYPLVARRLGQEGVVVLECLVQPDGRAEVMLKQGSGYAALDRAAIKLFEEAAGAMRTALAPDQPSRLEIPVAYRLQE